MRHHEEITACILFVVFIITITRLSKEVSIRAYLLNASRDYGKSFPSTILECEWKGYQGELCDFALADLGNYDEFNSQRHRLSIKHLVEDFQVIITVSSMAGPDLTPP